MKEMASTTSESEKDDSNPKNSGDEKKYEKARHFAGLNILDRDEKHINDTINLNFEDVLAEPDVAHGFDPIWRSAFFVFNGSRFFIYRLLSTFLAIPLALVWGIIFSLITFLFVWFFTPVLRIIDVFTFFGRRILVATLRMTLEPVANACGLYFSNIKVTHYKQLQTV